MSLIELRQLERFLAVIEHGSLVAAAKSLGLTQQALSTSLANLEKSLGVRLFDRGPGGVTRPTAYGLTLLPHARAQLAGDVRARQALAALAEGRSGLVTVGVGESFAGDAIATAIRELREQFPDVRVNLVEGYSEDLRQRLYEGEFDFIAAGVSAYELDQDYARELIYSTRDAVIARAGHPLAGRARLDLADLRGFSWLVPYSRASDLQAIVEAFTADNLEPPRGIVGSDAYRIGMRLLLATDLLMMVSPALVSPELLSDKPSLLRLATDRPTVQRNASLIYPRERPMTPPAAQLLALVRHHAKAAAAELETALAGRTAAAGPRNARRAALRSR
ncbi:MAG: LysR family transcriptional regulator [Chromatiales bacterium]|nr:LysR family transcriptional regulator [Chromatiales bacterium]